MQSLLLLLQVGEITGSQVVAEKKNKDLSFPLRRSPVTWGSLQLEGKDTHTHTHTHTHTRLEAGAEVLVEGGDAD